MLRMRAPLRVPARSSNGRAKRVVRPWNLGTTHFTGDRMAKAALPQRLREFLYTFLQDSPDSTGLEFLLKIRAILGSAYQVLKEMPGNGIFSVTYEPAE